MIAIAPSTLTKNGINTLDALTDKWYDALLAAGFIEDEFQAKAILAKLGEQARDLLLNEPFDPKQARFIGASLISLCQNKSIALACTQSVLARTLVENVTPDEMIALQPRLAHLLSELAVGFLQAQSKEVRSVSRSLLSKMGHDLNSPLNLIIGFSGIMMKGLSGPLTDLQQNDLTIIHNGGKKLQQRIDNLMGIVKVESCVTRLKEESFEIAPFVEEVVASVEPLVERNENHLTIDYINNGSRIKADKEMLEQVVVALLDNAAKFTVQGTIRLIVKCENNSNGDWITFEITDSGLGIPAKRLRALLQEPLNSLASGDNESSGSLLLCRRFCELMGGTLSATSVVGLGSTFTVRLPA